MMDTIKALVEHKKYDAITEYAKVLHGKDNLIVSEYCGSSVRLYKDNDNKVRILCPKNLETVQEGYLAKAIADGSVFDDADEIDRNASVIERTTLPYDAMLNSGKEMPTNLKPMIAIVVGRMGDDGNFGVTDADRTNGINFVKDATAANANGDTVNGVVDNYLEKKDGFYTPEIGRNISGLNNELGEVNSTDPANVVSDDDTVDSYDDYDMNDFERDPDAEPENEEGESDDDIDNDNDSDDDVPADNEEPVEDPIEEPVEECGDGACATKEVEECGDAPVVEEDDETLTQSMEEEPVEAGNGDLPVETAEEDDPIATGIANSIIAKYKRVSECGNTTTPTNGRTIVQEDDTENGEAPTDVVDDPTEPIQEETAPTEETMPDGSVNKTPQPMSQQTKDLVKEEVEPEDDKKEVVEEGFLSKKPKKLKPIGRDVVAYITCEMNDIHSANDQAMLAGYTCSKIELVDWYITCIDTQDPKYMVPHTRQYLVTMKAQLESLLAQILKIRPINRSEQIWRVNYPSYN
jgi:hypothetical protein